MNLLKLSLSMLRRDSRAGELRVLVAALVIAVGGMTTVGFFGDRVQQALAREANQLLGADLVLVSDHALPAAYADEALRRGLAVTTATKFPSMVASVGAGEANETNILSEIKAITPGYPLRGELKIIDGEGRAERIANAIPPPGEVWVDDKLMARLTLKLGDTLSVGKLKLQVSAVVMQEPDYVIGFINLGPRVLMNAADLPATGLVQLGSRISYRLMVAGGAGAVEELRAWTQARLQLGERLEGIRDARPEIKSALERAEKFLALTALASVVLAAAAMVLAVRRFTERHLDGCAVMRCLGASQNTILRLYLYHFIVLGLLASLIGCLLGYFAQAALSYWLAALVATSAASELPQPGWVPAIHGLLTGMVLLLGFALPPLLNLRKVPALRVLRRDLGMPNAHSLMGYAAGLAALAALILWKANDLRLGLLVLGGFILAVAVSGAIAYAMVRALGGAGGIFGINGGKPGGQSAGGAWRYGLASIKRRAGSSVLQAVALGLGLMALLVLTLIRDDLLGNWQTSLPPDAPNRFLVNIQPDQLPALNKFFFDHQIKAPAVMPMVRGRLTAINGKKITPDDYPDARAKRLVEREFNLSWAAEMQADNQIIAGRWWNPDERGKAVVSVEEGIAKTVGIKLGDTLTYDVAGAEFTAQVASLRKVNWDTFRVNFFVVAPPGVLENYPASYITSFHLPADRVEVMNALVKTFPNFLVIDVAAVIAQVQKVMVQVSKAVEFVFLFTLLAGFAVLYAAIVAAQDERIYEAAIFRTLGAKKRQLISAQAAEFAILGGIAGLFAAGGATGLSYVVSVHALNLNYSFNPWVILIGVVAGVAGVTAAGLLGTRATLSTPPLLTLRKMA